MSGVGHLTASTDNAFTLFWDLQPGIPQGIRLVEMKTRRLERSPDAGSIFLKSDPFLVVAGGHCDTERRDTSGIEYW